VPRSELRKSKRDENLQKKRMVHAGPSYAMEDSTRTTAQALQHKVGARAPSDLCLHMQT
jgi:Importin beta binding domain